MQFRWNIKRFKRFLIISGCVLLGLLAAMVILWRSFEWRFHQVPKPAVFTATQSRAEAVTQDLEYLGQLMSLDRSFSPEARDAFERGRHELIARAGSLTPEELTMEVSRLVALSGNGHTTMGRFRPNRLPIRVAWFAEGLYVVRASDTCANLLGAKVLSINGKTPEQLLAALQPYVSGTRDNARAYSPKLFESPAVLAGVWKDMSTTDEQISLRMPDGSIVKQTLAAITADPDAIPVALPRNLDPQPAPGEAATWRALLAVNKDLPLSLQNPDTSVYSVPLDGGKGVYINLREIDDDGKGDLAEQLDAILAGIPSASLRYAILDLRGDGGGNYTKTLGFTRRLPERIASDGKLFLLTDNATFSAAIVTLARAKYFGGARSVVIGEHVGDREQFWAESAAPLTLPNSKIRLYYATGYHDWQAGCHDWSRCFWVNLLFDVPAGSLAPDVPLAWRFADYRANVDTVFEAAHNMAQATLAAAGDNTSKTGRRLWPYSA